MDPASFDDEPPQATMTASAGFEQQMPPVTFSQRTLIYAALIAVPLAVGVLLARGAIALLT